MGRRPAHALCWLRSVRMNRRLRPMRRLLGHERLRGLLAGRRCARTLAASKQRRCCNAMSSIAAFLISTQLFACGMAIAVCRPCRNHARTHAAGAAVVGDAERLGLVCVLQPAGESCNSHSLDTPVMTRGFYQ